MDSNPLGVVQKTFWQKVSIVPIGLLFVGKTVYRSVVNVIPRSLNGWPVRRTLVVSFVQSAIDVFERRRDPQDMRWSTSQIIDGYSKKNDHPFSRIEIDCGPFHDNALLYEFAVRYDKDPTEPTASSRIVLYAHGGGYGNPPIPAHMPVSMSLCRSAKARHLFFLGYRLAPFATYPTQLVQAIESLRYLLEVRKIRPNDIILAGDSAGGNLVMAVLAHMKDPCPYAAPISTVTLLAVVAVSPWTAVHEVDGPSAKYAGKEDYIFIWHGQLLLNLWQPKHEVWAELVSHTDSNVDGFWQEDLSVKHLMITSGTWEASYSAHELLAKYCNATKIEIGFDGHPTDPGMTLSATDGPTRTFLVGSTEVHVTAGVDEVIGLKENGSFLALKRTLEHI